MSSIYLLNKPYLVLSQFTDNEGRSTLSDFIDENNVYPAGRLDYDSEGLLILTGDGALQARISNPKHKLPKTYWVQVEGNLSQEALKRLRTGVQLKDGMTRPAKAELIPPPDIWKRTPAIRSRANIPTSWLQLTITEGKNRQVRRMTAEVGYPTLRLIRYAIGSWTIEGLTPGQHKKLEVNLPATPKSNNGAKYRPKTAKPSSKRNTHKARHPKSSNRR